MINIILKLFYAVFTIGYDAEKEGKDKQRRDKSAPLYRSEMSQTCDKDTLKLSLLVGNTVFFDFSVDCPAAYTKQSCCLSLVPVSLL